RLNDPSLAALAARINVVRDERLEGRRHPFGSNVKIKTRDGVIERMTDDPSGEPDTFPAQRAMVDKFLLLARPVLDN
ncbi:MmgE/PrpD family protein, partial [Escherichia coli]|uniref:MmgE/PrpD family protein n=1 Tax=Escherichia coli TaxID=562 RepID=UPI0013CF47B6